MRGQRQNSSEKPTKRPTKAAMAALEAQIRELEEEHSDLVEENRELKQRQQTLEADKAESNIARDLAERCIEADRTRHHAEINDLHQHIESLNAALKIHEKQLGNLRQAASVAKFALDELAKVDPKVTGGVAPAS